MFPLLVFLLQQTVALGARNCSTSETILHNLSQGYKTALKPSEIGVKVLVEIWVQEVTGVNELTSDFMMDIYVSEFWVDKALRFEKMNPCKQNLSLNYRFLEQIWKPNTVFINTKYAEIHDSPFRNIFLLIYPNGTVWTNYRIKVVGPCQMDFTKFPMDSLKCFLTLESFSYNYKEAEMCWNPISEPVSVMRKEKNIELPDFTLVNWSTNATLKNYPAGVWNNLVVTFYFKRRFGWYILQAYVPTYLTIFVSWINFCLGIKMIPARTMICVNALLALIFQFGNIMRNLPKVSYVKALDVWMLMCLTFVVGSVVELALVAYWSREDVQKPQKSSPRQAGKTYQSIQSAMTSAMPMREQREQSFHVAFRAPNLGTVSRIDRVSGFLFPFCFALFNIVYWTVYLTIE